MDALSMPMAQKLMGGRLSGLFLQFLFGQGDMPETAGTSLFEKPSYETSEEFQRAVSHGGDPDPDDALYIWECVWEFEKGAPYVEKAGITLDFIETEFAERIIENDMRNGDCGEGFEAGGGGTDSYEAAKAGLLKSCLASTSERAFSEPVREWLFRKCLWLSMDCGESDGFIDGETLGERLERFLGR